MIDDIYSVSMNIRRIIALSGIEPDDESVRDAIEEYVFCNPEYAYRSFEESRMLIDSVFNCLRKDMGILQKYMDDDRVTEIMVNGPDVIFIEDSDRIYRAPEQFYSVDELEEMIRRIAGRVRKEFNEMNPILDARLEDGSRVNAVYKNIAIGGPVLTVRKFPKDALTMDKLIDSGTVTYEAAVCLEELVAAGYSVFISGGTSSGKTTFLNCLTEYIPEDERLIVIEDSAELQVKNHRNVVRLECRAANSQGIGAVTMTDLIKSSLRMRPSRIIVGEVRGGEVADMINANNTGHMGSLSTGHGNSIEGMIKRLEAMFLQATDYPMSAIRAQISEGIDVFVHLQRMPDMTRKVTEIAEVTGLDGDRYVLNTLYRYVPGEGLEATGNGIENDYKFRISKN